MDITDLLTDNPPSIVPLDDALEAKLDLTLRSPREIAALEFPPEDILAFNGVFAKGQPTVIVGPGGVGKSRLVLQMAAAIVTGKEFPGINSTPQYIRCLVLQGENSNRRLKADMKSLRSWVGEEHWPTLDEHLVIHTLEQEHDQSLRLNDVLARERIARLIKEVQPDIVIWDPLYAFSAGNLSTDDGMLATLKAIMDLTRQGKPSAIPIIVHHTLTGKAGAKKATGWDRASYGRGSKALHFWTRGQINIAPASDEDNSRLVISCGKNSNGPEFDPFGIRLNPDTMIYEPDPEFDLNLWRAELDSCTALISRPTPQAIAELVNAHPIKRSTLVNLVMETYGCKKSTAYTIIAAANGKTIRRNSVGEFIAI